MLAEEVVQLWNRLRTEGSDHKMRMRRMAEIVDGDMAIPLPELGVEERPAIVNLAYRGTMSFSQSLSGLQPSTKFGPLKRTKLAEEAAFERMRVSDWWDQEDKTPLLDAQRGRYIFAYGAAPTFVDMNVKERRPIASIPSPLNVFAPRPPQANDICPPFGIAAMHMPVATILKRYGGNLGVVLALKDWSSRPEEEFWILEYADEVEAHLVLAGPVLNQFQEGRAVWSAQSDPSGATTLHRRAHRLENDSGPLCPWVMPGLINLNKAQGYFDQIVGMYQAQAMITGIELQHAARSVFQETWMVGRAGEVPQIMVDADPITGVIGEMRGADIKTIAPDPQFHTHSAMDRLQEAAMMTAGMPADTMGKASSNVRTGRRAAQIVSAAVDPMLQEVQTIMSLAKQEINKRRIAIDKAWFSRPKQIQVTWRGKIVESTYEAGELWETDRCLVEYPVSGTDTNSLTILVGQLQGMGLMSDQKSREILPFFTDPDGEAAQVKKEQLEAVLMEKLAELVGSPDSPFQPMHIGELIKRVGQGDDLTTALEAVQRMMQEEQTTPVEATAPEAAPGLGGAGAIPPPIAGPTQGQQNLASTLGAIRMPERQVQLSSGGRA